MTIASRIRIYLAAAAVIPPLLIMAVIYFHSVRQLESSDRRQALRNLARYERFAHEYREECRAGLDSLLVAESLRRAEEALASRRPERIDLDPRTFGFDFLELLDSNHRVVFSHHRRGLLGEEIHPDPPAAAADSLIWAHTLEYDVAGAHIALTAVGRVHPELFVYCGRYLDEQYQQRLSGLLEAGVAVFTDPAAAAAYQAMEPGRLYQTQDGIQAVLARSGPADALVLATFATGEARPLFVSLLQVTGLVGAVSVTAAILLGVYVTGRAKREIDNLVQAADRIAGGDLDSPVMAYDEGEFAKLADAFTHMIAGLKAARRQLATAEKIAAWQTAGRKMAHEIKNPLMPISICVDDLRRSYHEGLPDFERTLEETTATIRGEIDRVARLLDQFAGFARMSAPVIVTADPAAIIEALAGLYRHEVDTGRLKIVNRGSRRSARLDPEALKQVLVNLVKNGFEAAEHAQVAVTLGEEDGSLVYTVEDNGPGFSEEKLRSSFEPYVSTKKGGSGLGLVICHRIVHDHEGRMDLYNREGGGAGVRVTLPQQQWRAF